MDIDIYDPEDVGPPKSPLMQPMSAPLIDEDDYQWREDSEPFDGRLSAFVLDLFPGLIKEKKAEENDAFILGSDPKPEENHYDITPLYADRPTRHPQMDLPMIVGGLTIHSRPDSGCEENIMSAEIAAELNLPIMKSARHKKRFRVANGNEVEAVGMVTTYGCFPNEFHREMSLDFYVFPQLVTPLIMGMSFLAWTHTLTAHTHRLMPREPRVLGPYRVSLVDNPTRRIRCIAASSPAIANPDTGSDIDLISLSYAMQRQLQLESIHDEESEVEFADGSKARLTGKVTIPLIVCSESPLEGEMTFYVLNDLTCDILFGEDFLHTNEIFQKHQTAFTSTDAEGLSDFNTILWSTRAERRFSRLLTRRKGEIPSSSITEGTAYVTSEPVDAPSLQHQRDARELHRREMSENAIEHLTGQERETATRLEADRRARYDSGLEYSAPVPDASSTPSRSLPTPNIQNTGSATLHSITDLLGSVGSRAKEKITQLSSPLSGYIYDARNMNASHADNTQDEDDDRRSRAATPGTDDAGSTPVTSMDRSSIDDIPTLQPESYLCRHSGCTAAPFHTQYLLNSHMKVHSSNRPHFCSIKGCPRGEGGRGFQRKIALIKHRFAHRSCSYECPFCPDREHTYPRPDNLMRHVRVYHTDKDKDDPRLREVLT